MKTLIQMQNIIALKIYMTYMYPYTYIIPQGWAKYIDSVFGYKYKYIKNVQVQVQVQGFAKCTWVQLSSTKYKCII